MRVAAPFRAPRFIDLPSINLDNEDRVHAGQRMGRTWMYLAWMAPVSHGTRI
jgi:hypothetical protein